MVLNCMTNITPTARFLPSRHSSRLIKILDIPMYISMRFLKNTKSVKCLVKSWGRYSILFSRNRPTQKRRRRSLNPKRNLRKRKNQRRKRRKRRRMVPRRMKRSSKRKRMTWRWKSLLMMKQISIKMSEYYMYKSAGSAMKREPNSNSNSASSMNTSSNSNNRSARSKNTGSFQTADSGGSLGFNGGQGLGNNNNSVNGPQESSNGTFVTAMSPRTAIRYNTAKSAEARRLKQPVPPQLLNKFRKNVQDLGRNIPRDSGAKISKILKSG